MAQILKGGAPALVFERPPVGSDEFSTPPTDNGALDYEGAILRSAHPVELLEWQRVNSELRVENVHHYFWWNKHSGKTLAILLHCARYSSDLQYRDLKFFAQVIAPSLGVSREEVGGDSSSWSSFMTDDGTPLELSWDWGTGNNQPMVRYSIEPIGLFAGTSLDPNNLIAGFAFQGRLLCSLPNMRLEWFHHFRKFFDVRSCEEASLTEAMPDHKSSTFYAFDLSKTEVTAKVYFFPKTRAAAYKQSSLEVLYQAIYAAPYSTEDKLKAASIFRDFASDTGNETLEYEMLAIDLIDPMESRIKIYFRCRETTFNSVMNIMTLGGRIKSPMLHQGLGDLHRLWNALFGVNTTPDQPLGEVNHRTAGILYNVEFRLGDAFPIAKVYLPVRHYSNSDEAVICGLDRYFQYHKRSKYMPNYVRAMSTIITPTSSRAQSGVQTYVGCTIRPDGALRVVSYFKP
ncbi:tryptophan dimethylallyltransferase-domain-containing protein [Jackrogersella minutella]|nr:tryptophan dimethylallyltransferase-domain-containing protein [Jackrogersella minutella]